MLITTVGADGSGHVEARAQIPHMRGLREWRRRVAGRRHGSRAIRKDGPGSPPSRISCSRTSIRSALVRRLGDFPFRGLFHRFSQMVRLFEATLRRWAAQYFAKVYIRPFERMALEPAWARWASATQMIGGSSPPGCTCVRNRRQELAPRELFYGVATIFGGVCRPPRLWSPLFITRG